MIKKTFSVIGLGYGDEGKGTVVDWLASQYPKNSLVIRRSGGHQVGHTVKIGELLHEFRNFGSGTFRGVPTYYDKACTVSPLEFHMEYDLLFVKAPTIKPIVYVHPKALVATIYDMAYNRAKDSVFHHGSVGLGFAATIKRSNFIPLYVFNLNYKFVIIEKIKHIIDYYDSLTTNEHINREYHLQLDKLLGDGFSLDEFLESCDFFMDNTIMIDIEKNDAFADSFEYIIYEGNQGILLDKFHGFFPHVTYGHTTSKTVGNVNEIFYVTRAYATKHGEGLLNNELIGMLPLINNQYEQNINNPYQGKFRTAILDYEYLRYAIVADETDLDYYDPLTKKNLIITCMDQIKNPVITMGKSIQNLVPEIFEGLVDKVYVNNSPESSTIVLTKDFNYGDN